jgi:hypothetical protein
MLSGAAWQQLAAIAGFNAAARTIMLRRRDALPEWGRHGPEWRLNVLNRFSGPSPMPGEAEVRYLDGDFRVVRPGAFVRCAITNVPIPLEELKYWSVELQEAYSTPEAVLQRHSPGRLKSA